METREALSGGQQRLIAWLNAPEDPRGLAAFRILFGALMFLGGVRFWGKGWIHELYVAPSYHFTYLGFDWVKPWPGAGMYVHFSVMLLSALALMAGAFTRVAAAVFFLTFTYAELIEKAAYLNHYYFASLVALLLVFVPSEVCWSVDAIRQRPGRPAAPRWAYLLLRAQVFVVYFFAGFAKLTREWLFEAQPLRTWLPAHADIPLVGSLLTEAWTAHAMSLAGAFYDLTIVGFLLHRKSRSFAYAVTVLFHTTVWLLFPIGIFSFLMMAAATLFFAPSWPARLVRFFGKADERASGSLPTRSRLGAIGAGLAGAYVLVQIALPLRFLLYRGDVNWTGEGFRFAWRVMLVEKAGHVEFDVHTGDGSRYRVHPRAELTPLQYKMMSTGPDMIHEYALALAERFRKEGHENVRVYANAFSALNSSPQQQLIDPNADLARMPRSLGRAGFIVPRATPDLPRASPPEKHVARRYTRKNTRNVVPLPGSDWIWIPPP